MIGVYARVLRTPGVPRLVAAFLAAGTAITMTPVALVLFARDATQSFATASVVLAAQVIGNLVLSPARGRLVDRLAVGAVVAGQLLSVSTTHAAIAGSCVATLLTFVIASARAPTLTPART